MLVSRQVVGRIRYLSGKIFLIQAMVLQRAVAIGQVPTTWNYSDIGTKPLSRTRLLVLLNQLGATYPDNLQMVGQEEYEVAAEHVQSQQSLKRLAKGVFRMAAVWGVESGFQGAAAIDANEVCKTCQVSAFDNGNSWLWLTIILMLALLVGLAIEGYRMVKQQVWDQVGDEDSYIAVQEQRIDALVQKCDALQNQLDQIFAEVKDEIQTVSNETSMVHDYASGFHYSSVENGF